MFLVQARASPAPDIWHALADPTRRTLIDRLAGGAKSTSQLCEGMPMTRFGVMKHLAVLERAGLVIARRHGRLRLNHLNAAPLRALQSRWLSARAEELAQGIFGLADSLKGDVMSQPDPATSTGVIDVALEWPVAASVQRVWEALFQRPESWWPAAHRAGGEGSVMRFEPRIGGQLREEGPDGGGVVWYSVIALDPLRSVDLAGQLAARYGGPATSLLHLEIVPGAGEGTSLLKLTDSIFGRIGPGMRASLAGGWQAIVGEGLVAHLDGGEAA
jgi:DNA-binding transcriptional ArsR family regulator